MNEDELLELNYKAPKRNTHGPRCPCYTCSLEKSFKEAKKRLNAKKILKDKPKENGKIRITIPRITLPTIVFGQSLEKNK